MEKIIVEPTPSLNPIKTKYWVDYLRIITNIFLGIILLISIITILLYKQETKEVMLGEEPTGLMQLYENRTDTKCLCANPKYGQVTLIKNTNGIQINFSDFLSS